MKGSQHDRGVPIKLTYCALISVRLLELWVLRMSPNLLTAREDHEKRPLGISEQKQRFLAPPGQ